MNLDLMGPLVDLLPVGVCLFDANYVVLAWNTCLENWTHRERETVVGTRLTEVYPNLAQRRYAARIEPVFHGGPPVVFSSRLHTALLPTQTPDGLSQKQTCVIKPALHPETGEVLAMLVVRDVTDQSRMNEGFREMRDRAVEELNSRRLAEQEMAMSTRRLRHAQESLDLFAGVASQELRGPLRRIQAYASLIDTDDLDRTTTAWIDHIRGSAYRMETLVNDLVAYGNVDYDGDDLQEVFLGDAVEDVATELDVELTESGATLTIDASIGRMASVHAHPEGVRQILRALLMNAVAYRESRRPLRVVVRAVDWTHDETTVPSAVLVVEDNGPGIPREAHERIFRPFVRVADERVAGSGMGLATCRRICEMIGAHISVSSELGQGAVFRVRFPLACPAARLQAA